MDYILIKLYDATFAINKAFADIGFGTAPGEVQFTPPFGINSFGVLFDRLMGFLGGLALVIAPLIIIYGGYKIMFGGGDPKQYEEGVNIIKYTIIGLIVIFLSVMIVNIVKRLFV